MRSVKAREWAEGWQTVASGSVGMIFVGGVSSVTGVVMAPLGEKFGWSRTLVTSNIMICAVLTLLLAPVIGHAIGRYGVRRCAIAGTLTAIPALAGIALNPGSESWWVASWIVFAVFNALLGPLLWTTAITELFDKARGLALAVTLSGSGIAFAIFPPLALLVIDHFGWRGVYYAFAILFALVLLPCVMAWFRGRVDVAVTRDPGLLEQPHSSRPEHALALGRALRSRHFWQLALVCLLVAGVEGALSIHLYPILDEGGLAPLAAAGAASAMGWALIVGRLGTGIMQDRWPARFVFAAAIGALIVSCVLAQVFAGDQMGGVLIAVLLGIGAGGTINSLAYLVGRYFSLAAYASMFGLLMGVFAVGYGVSPMIASYARDLAGGYPPLIPIFLAMLAVSMMLTLFLGKEKDAFPT